MILTSKEFYDKFSSHYHEYSKQRQRYLKKIDELICASGRDSLSSSLVDIGCGYGTRAIRLAKSLGIKNITLVDNSPGMLNYLDASGNDRILSDVSDNDFLVGKKYDMVLCLWNVLGHIETKEKRVAALKNMAHLLTDNGKLYIDVNNRYNTAHYGIVSVIRNIFASVFLFYKKNGDFPLQVKNPESTLRTKVHIFTNFEMNRLFKASKLRILERKIIDYQDGTEKKSSFAGQLFFIASKQ